MGNGKRILRLLCVVEEHHCRQLDFAWTSRACYHPCDNERREVELHIESVVSLLVRGAVSSSAERKWVQHRDAVALAVQTCRLLDSSQFWQ